MRHPTRPTRRGVLRGLSAAAGAAFLGPLHATMRALAAEHRGLRITAVEPYVLMGGKCFVIVRTSEGLKGIGEVSPMNSRTAAHLIRTAFEPLLVGRNPLDIERCWERVFYRTYKQGVMGLQPEALAGVDIALWDILGKAAGLPIHRLLGGRRRESVRMYSSIGGGSRSTTEQMVERAVRSVERGFTAVKIRMDYGPLPPDVRPEGDVALLAAVREAIGPDVELMYDVNNGYTANTAIRVGRAIEELGVIHYEEPVAQTDYAGYAKVADAVDVAVAAGEHEYTRWQFRDLIGQGNPDVLQPDLVKCAGISEAVKIAALASAHHKPLVPHQTQPTIGTAANLHYVSVFASGDMAQELNDGSLDSALHGLFERPLRFEGGRMPVPEGPGLGLELDEGRMREMAV